MSRPDWWSDAERLYAEHGSYAEVARQLDRDPASVRYALLSDEERERVLVQQRESQNRYRRTEKGKETLRRENKRRRGAKQEHARAARSRCSRCGAWLGQGSSWPSHAPKSGLCRNCRFDDWRAGGDAHKETVQRLWNEGKKIKEIAAEMDTTPGTVAQWLHRMRQEPERWNVPRRQKARQ